ncbi:MAG: 2-oxoglutarate and iron-dependent oxygenase domain-containing protein, partial [Steroidobacteraceae bacterium]
MPDAIEPVSYRLAKRDPGAFVRHFAGSFERYGFAVVSDHELPQPLIDDCLGRFKRFFGQDEDTKRRYQV